MMKKIFDMDGPVMGFLDGAGQLIVLSLLWILGCLPVITICTSNAALYHAVMRSVRQGEGSAVREFFTSYQENLFRGIALTLLLVGLPVGLEAVSIFVMNSVVPYGVIFVCMILDFFVLVYAGPVLSRSHRGIGDILKLSFAMSLQYAHYTFLFLVGSAVLLVLTWQVLPMAMALIIPGLWTFGVTFLMERVLGKYLPPDTDRDD